MVTRGPKDTQRREVGGPSLAAEEGRRALGARASWRSGKERPFLAGWGGLRSLRPDRGLPGAEGGCWILYLERMGGTTLEGWRMRWLQFRNFLDWAGEGHGNVEGGQRVWLG